MRNYPRVLRFTAAGAVIASLAACGSTPMTQPVGSYPSTTYPTTTSSYPATGSTAPASLEYGRVTGIEYVPPSATTTGSTAGSPNVLGAVVGGLGGAVLGRQIGGGSGRDAATVLGGVAGAAIGSQVGRGQQAPAATAGQPSYRISVQTDQGATRMYEVPSPGELRVGDRVRVENGVIYRS